MTSTTLATPTATAPTAAAGTRSRRSFLKGAAVVGLAAAAVGLPAPPGASAASSVIDILTVARTAEQLAVTFYSRGLDRAHRLGLKKLDIANLQAALIEEQIHLDFFAANGGQSLANVFSFPRGHDTFENLELFIATQQQLEGVFDSAFLAAIKEFSQLGEHRLAQIAGQIACIESEHRALGRQILAERGKRAFIPADNWAFAPVLVKQVADAPALVKEAGYLSPPDRGGPDQNRFVYRPADFKDPALRPIVERIQYKTPFTVSGD